MADTSQIGSIFTGMTLGDVIRFAAVLAVGIAAVVLVMKLLDRVTEKTGASRIYRMFLRGVIRTALYLVVVFAALSAAGVNVTSLVALFSVIGLAASLAAQGVLGNIAGGLQVMSVHPFSTGDYVEIGDKSGTVTELGLLYTVLSTPDGFRVHIPNSTTVSASIVNYTVQGKRRLDIAVGLPYDTDPEEARGALLPLLENEPKLLKDPAPQVLLTAYQDSSVQYTLRAWTGVQDYWDVRFSLQEKLWKALKDRGISIPYPQLDVHMDAGGPHPGQVRL